MDHDERRRRVHDARVARLATVDSSGRPHLVPLCFALVDSADALVDSADDTVYSAVDGKPKRTQQLRRLANIASTGRACLLVDGYDEDWTQLWWVRIDGPARVVTDPVERERAIGALVAKYPQYQRQPPDGPVLAVRAETWTAWTATTA